jgi:hypothetical protein
MMVVVLVLVFLAACVLSVVVPDHRDLDDRDRRGWWPGSPRSW